ncbi:hypothetical protein D3C73_1009890 [compost metagenome]
MQRPVGIQRQCRSAPADPLGHVLGHALAHRVLRERTSGLALLGVHVLMQVVLCVVRTGIAVVEDPQATAQRLRQFADIHACIAQCHLRADQHLVTQRGAARAQHAHRIGDAGRAQGGVEPAERRQIPLQRGAGLPCVGGQRPHRRPEARPGEHGVGVLGGGVVAHLHQRMQAGTAWIDVALLHQGQPLRGIGLGKYRIVGGPEAVDIVGPHLCGRCGRGGERQQQGEHQRQWQAHPSLRGRVAAEMRRAPERFRRPQPGSAGRWPATS